MRLAVSEGMIKLAREKSVRVEDIMTRDLIILEMATKVSVAAAILSERRISGAPVVSRTGAPVGVITRTDLLDPRHQGPDATVEQAMTRVIYAVRPTDSAMAAVRLMVAEKLHRVVVVEQSGRICGIVTSMDVMRSLAKGSADDDEIAVEYIKLAKT